MLRPRRTRSNRRASGTSARSRARSASTRSCGAAPVAGPDRRARRSGRSRSTAFARSIALQPERKHPCITDPPLDSTSCSRITRSRATTSGSRTSGVAVRAGAGRARRPARESMRAARALVDQAARAHVRRQHRLRPLRFESIPEELTGELQLRLLRSHACGVGEPYPGRGRARGDAPSANALAKGYSGARVETIELLLDCLNRGLLPRVPARGSVGASGDLAPLAHLALPLVGEGGPASTASSTRARMPWPRRPRADQAGGQGRPLADQRHAVHGGDGRPRAGARTWLARTADLACALSLEALQGSRRASTRRSTRPARTPGRSPRPRTSSACSRAPRSSSRTAGATRCKTPTRSLRASGSRREPRPARLRRGDRRRRAERLDRQPARARRRGTRRLERQLPRPAARLRSRPPAMAVAELANISERRVERLVNPALSTACRRSSPRGRTELGVHDPAVRGRGAREREQGPLPSRERRLDSDERRPGGPRLDGERGRASRRARRSGTPSRPSRSSCLREPRPSSSSRRSSRGWAPRATRAFVRTLAAAPRTTDRSPPTSSPSQTAVADGSLLAAVELEIGALR